MVILFYSEPGDRPLVDAFLTREAALNCLMRRWEAWTDGEIMMVERCGRSVMVESEDFATMTPDERNAPTETFTFEFDNGKERLEYSAAIVDTEVES